MLATHVVHGELVGLMPMLRDRDYHGRPLPHLANWLHSNAFSGEPLVRADHCASFWQHTLDWCDRHAHGSLFFHLSGIPADGAALAALRDIAGKPDRGLRIVEIAGHSGGEEHPNQRSNARNYSGNTCRGKYGGQAVGETFCGGFQLHVGLVVELFELS